MENSLISRLLPQGGTQLLHRAVLVGLGVVVLAVSAHIQLPFWPVPMTLQTLAVLLIAATAGLRLGVSTLLAYLASGAVGLPVFAGGAGLAYMAGPTGGYLAGFVLAAAIVGWLADRGHGRKVLSAVAMLLAGDVAIFALGTGWLSVLFGAEKAVADGLLLFIPGEILKIALGSAVLFAAWKHAKR